MSATPHEFLPTQRRRWDNHTPIRPRTRQQTEKPKIQDEAGRAQNAWDFLQTIRNPQYIADRLKAGESIVVIAAEYNNVTTGMIRRLVRERCRPEPKPTHGPKPMEIDWERVDALRELGYSYRKIGTALGIHGATLARRAARRRK